ncbi:MAG: FtsX-like permease family protein [Coprococcus sp.]|nr:FtsX-like permease family protein [Coprococcus sp.]
MKNCFLLVRSNLRKAKGQAAAIIVLIFLAALTLNLWLMLSMDYRQNFDRSHDRLHAGHVTLAVDGNIEEMQGFIEKTVENDERTDDFSLEPSMHMVGLFQYNGGEVNTEFAILERETALSASVGRAEIVEDSEFTSGIYMPMLYKSEDIAVGKTIEIFIGTKKMSYTVCGFFNSVMTGSHNCMLCELILTEDKYKELEETGYAPVSTLCSIRLKDKGKSEEFETMLKDAVSSRYPGVRSVSNSYALVTSSRYISQMVCSGIMSAMSFCILLIALVVTASNIVNYIQENMKDLGALKAVGYTSSQLIGSLMLQFTGLSLIFAMAGAGLSYGLFPAINTMMISQTGIPYEIHFLPVPFLLTLIILGGTIAFVVWLYSYRIKKIEPITALRQGVRTHSFKKNHVPLEKAKVPLNLALALKTTLSGKKHNVTVCITMLVLSLVAVFSGLMVENIIADTTPFIELIVGEMADSCINVEIQAEEEFIQEMDQDPRVEKAYLYNSTGVRHVGGVELVATICDDFSKVNNQKVIIEGRFPKYENETAIAAKYAKEQGLRNGDEIALASEGKEEKYIITGFTQISNNLGKDCLFTREGYERMGTNQNVSYYLNLTDGTDIDDFNTEVKKKFGNQANAAIDIKATVEGGSSVYVSLMTMIVIAVLILSVIVITFVLYLLVRTMLGNKKREYGILKALGFTTRQLILQTALSFMPAAVFSTVVGVTVCSMIINPLTALFLNGIGIVKCTFTVPTGLIAAEGAGLILLAFVMACLLSLKIRKIAPKELLMGE